MQCKSLVVIARSFVDDEWRALSCPRGWWAKKGYRHDCFVMLLDWIVHLAPVFDGQIERIIEAVAPRPNSPLPQIDRRKLRQDIENAIAELKTVRLTEPSAFRTRARDFQKVQIHTRHLSKALQDDEHHDRYELRASLGVTASMMSELTRLADTAELKAKRTQEAADWLEEPERDLDGSPNQLFFGAMLPLIFRHHFGQRETVSKPMSGRYSAYIEFAHAVGEQFGIPGHAKESIITAMKKGRELHPRPRLEDPKRRASWIDERMEALKDADTDT